MGCMGAMMVWVDGCMDGVDECVDGWDEGLEGLEGHCFSRAPMAIVDRAPRLPCPSEGHEVAHALEAREVLLVGVLAELHLILDGHPPNR